MLLVRVQGPEKWELVFNGCGGSGEGRGCEMGEWYNSVNEQQYERT